jgi:hypothetical protein
LAEIAVILGANRRQIVQDVWRDPAVSDDKRGANGMMAVRITAGRAGNCGFLLSGHNYHPWPDPD